MFCLYSLFCRLITWPNIAHQSLTISILFCCTASYYSYIGFADLLANLELLKSHGVEVEYVLFGCSPSLVTSSVLGILCLKVTDTWIIDSSLSS